MPRITVIMGIYNCAPTLREALDSLWVQSFQDFDIVMCDDGSKDDTYAVARAISDELPGRITLLRNEENLGLNLTLNKCLAAASGEYIARMDGDDISLPERFEREVDFLDSHPEYAFVSAPMIHFDENGEFMRGSGGFTPQTGRDFLAGRTYCHAPVMIRKEAFDAVGGYSVSKYLLRLEDQHLWFKLHQAGYRGHNLTECLYMMRDDRNATARRGFTTRRNEMLHRLRICRTFRLPWWLYVQSVAIPFAKWAAPSFIYNHLHRAKR